MVDRATRSDHTYLSVVVDSVICHKDSNPAPAQCAQARCKRKAASSFAGLLKGPLPLVTESLMLSQELDELYDGLVTLVVSPEEALRQVYVTCPLWMTVRWSG